MPLTGGTRGSSKTVLTDKLKRRLVVGVVAVVTIFVSSQFVASTNSLAQKTKRAVSRAEQTQLTSSDCSYLKSPEEFRGAQARHRELVSRTTEAFSTDAMEAGLNLVQASDLPRKNFIDDILFDRMQRDGVLSAPLCTDEEFLRRVYLDLTGRIPWPEDVTNFVQDRDP
jgi:hypothetical protein